MNSLQFNSTHFEHHSYEIDRRIVYLTQNYFAFTNMIRLLNRLVPDVGWLNKRINLQDYPMLAPLLKSTGSNEISIAMTASRWEFMIL